MPADPSAEVWGVERERIDALPADAPPASFLRLSQTEAFVDAVGGRMGNPYDSGYIIRVFQPVSDHLVVFNESYHPGWQAFGAHTLPVPPDEPLVVRRAAGDFIGIEVARRYPEIRLQFRPLSYYLGRIVTIVALTASCLWMLLLLPWPFRQEQMLD